MHTIKAFLREKEMTQAELASKLKLGQPYVSMVISGKRPITDTFRWRWVEAFGPSAILILNGDTHAKS